MTIEQRYIDSILHVSLQLREGEALSVNSTDRNMEFAQKIAQKASEITRIPVKLVSIEEGQVKEVFTVDPVHSDILKEDSQEKVLLYLAEPLDMSLLEDASLGQIAGNPPLLQQAGNLCPPQMDRPVAPFAVAPVPTLAWARRLYPSSTDPLETFWSFLSSIYPLSDTFLNDWIDTFRRLVQIVKRVNTLDPAHLIITQQDTTLSLGLLDAAQARQPLHHLPPDRVFLPRITSRGISFLPDPSRVQGTISASRQFTLLGREVTDLTLTFDEGHVTDYGSSQTEEVIEKALSIDGNAGRIGQCTLVEEISDIQNMPILMPYEFLESITSFITLGGGESNHLKHLELYESEEDLQDKTGMNISLLKSDIPFGTQSTAVDIVTREGNRIPLMRDGKFILIQEHL